MVAHSATASALTKPLAFNDSSSVASSGENARERSAAALRELFPIGRSGMASPPRYNEAVVVRDIDGEIVHVQVSRWRRIAAGPRRRIADVVKLDSGEIAILIEKTTGASSLWQVYDLDGHLDALLQCSADGQFGVLLDYCVGDVSRLAYQPGRGLQIVETRPL